MVPWLVVNGSLISILLFFIVVVSTAWLLFLSNFLYGFIVDNVNSYVFFDLGFFMGLYAVVMLVIFGVIQYPFRRGVDLYYQYKGTRRYLIVTNGE